MDILIVILIVLAVLLVGGFFFLRTGRSTHTPTIEPAALADAATAQAEIGEVLTAAGIAHLTASLPPSFYDGVAARKPADAAAWEAVIRDGFDFF